MPLVSDSWERQSTRGRRRRVPRRGARAPARLGRAAAENGQRLRLWATPDAPGPAREAVWRELLAAGVGYINTDDLRACATSCSSTTRGPTDSPWSSNDGDDRGRARPRPAPAGAPGT